MPAGTLALELDEAGSAEQSQLVRARSLHASATAPAERSPTTAMQVKDREAAVGEYPTGATSEVDPTATGSRRKLTGADVVALHPVADAAAPSGADLPETRSPSGAPPARSSSSAESSHRHSIDVDTGSASVSNDGRMSIAAEALQAPKPPILASRILAEDLAPIEPGRRTLRFSLLGLGGLGIVGAVAATLVTGSPSSPATVAAVVFSVAAVAGGVVKVSYGQRAALAFGLGIVAGLASRGWFDALLFYATVVLGGGLLFRSYYRASTIARAVVTLGTLALSLWFALSGHIEGLIFLDPTWQSWAPQIPRVGLALLALLSLLAFMNSSTTGGAAVWAASLFAMHALHLGLFAATELVAAWTASATHPPSFAMDVALAAMAALGAIGLAQALATLAGASPTRPTSTPPPPLGA